MNESSFNWDDLRLFLAVARKGGLAAAAQHTGKSAATLGRRLLALEQLMGVELFNRLPRGYTLTEQGELLLAKVEALEAGIQPIVSAVANKRARRVKISAGAWVTHLLCQKTLELAGDLPVLLQFISADHVLDISHREAVIGIRNQRPSEVSLAGRVLGRVRFAVYAVNEAIEPWVQVVATTPSAQWVKNNLADEKTVEVTEPRNALDLALAGVAKVVLPTFVGDATDHLQKVSPDIEELEHMQWLVIHHEDRHLPEVRQVADQLYEMLKQSEN